MKKMETLPNDCLITILSFTTPRDVIRFLSTSSLAQAVAGSDALWETFLPSDYNEILSRLVSPIQFKSKKELFLGLSIPHHVDEGNKLVWLDRFTGKKCYMLSARELSITWGSNPSSWSWRPLVQSRFPEVVEIVTTWWLEISGKIHCRMLSSNTKYKAYLILKFSTRAYGLDTLPSEVTVELGYHQRSHGTVFLRPEDTKSFWEQLGLVSRKGSTGPKDCAGTEAVHERPDGWFEIELGEFYNYGNDEVVYMSLKETEGAHLKGGLIVEGIEIRPSY